MRPAGMADAVTTVGDLRACVQDFVRARDWERFHRPRDLAMALSVEASELVELYLWQDDKASKRSSGLDRTALADELADVVIYALSVCNAVGLDLSEAVADKIRKNEVRYPADRVRGVAPSRTPAP